MYCRLIGIVIFLVVTGITVLGNDLLKDGYVITLSNDTLYEKIYSRTDLKNYQTCIVRNEKGDISYLPSQLKGFGTINENFFVSGIVDDQFVEVLVEGAINLYTNKSDFILKKDTSIYTFKKGQGTEITEDGEIVKVDNRWKGILNYLLSDCISNSVSLTENLTLNEKGLTRIIVKYNTCKGTFYKEVKANQPWAEFHFGASAGVTNSMLVANKYLKAYPFEYLVDSYHSLDPVIGIIGNISMPRISDNLSIQGELNFLKSYYSSSNTVSSTYVKHYDTYIHVTTLSVPVSLKYRFNGEHVNCYIQGGGVFDFNIHSNTKVLEETQIDDEVITSPERTAFDVKKFQGGFWGGIGLGKMFHKLDCSLELRYYKLNELNKTFGFQGRFSRVSLNLIVLKR